MATTNSFVSEETPGETRRAYDWVVGNTEVIPEVLVNALTVHVKYWEELVRFPD